MSGRSDIAGGEIGEQRILAGPPSRRQLLHCALPRNSS